MNAPSAATELRELEFEGSILVAGYLAAVYAAGAASCPVKHWGHEWVGRSLPFGDHLVTATRSTREIDGKPRAGALIVIHFDHYRGGSRKVKRFIPFEEFAQCSLIVRGVEIQ